jgi:hypothetical protein
MASPFFTASASVGGFAEPDADLARLERAARAARARNTIIRANKERWALQTRETIDATDWYQPYIEILGRFSGDSLQRFGGLGWSAYQAGSLAPLIRTEQDLNILRIPSQIAAWTNPYYQAMRRVVVNYAGGDGWTYAADVEEDAGYPGMKEAYQGLIDDHLEYNGWGSNGVGEAEQPGIEGEAIDRWVVHGEFVMRENRKSDGCTDLRILHPGQMTRPITGDPLAWSYGVHTDKFDAQKPIEYNLRYGPTPGDDDEIVDAGDLLHIKNNVWRDCKRGVPDGVFGTLDTSSGATSATRRPSKRPCRGSRNDPAAPSANGEPTTRPRIRSLTPTHTPGPRVAMPSTHAARSSKCRKGSSTKTVPAPRPGRTSK